MSKEDDLVQRLAEMMAEFQRQAIEAREAADKAKLPPRLRIDSEQIHVAVERVNRNFAVVLGGGLGKVVILHEFIGEDGRPDFELFSPEDLRLYLRKESYWNGGSKPTPLGDIWLADRNRREHPAIIFAPEKPPRGESWAPFNTWTGFTVEPSDVSLETAAPTFLDHMHVNVSGGDPARLHYIWSWFAQMIQAPVVRPGVALVFRGKQGCGKTKVGEVIGGLFGPHHLIIDDPRYLVGQFNAHLKRLLLLQVDEGFWAGSKEHEGHVKGIITGNTIMLEYKKIDPMPVRNLIRVILTSNERWVVPAALDSRRFAVFDMADHALGNAEYFRSIDEEMAAGGAAALLGFLLRYDLAGLELRDIPETRALADQKLESMDALEAWWHDRLCDGEIRGCEDEAWQTGSLAVPKDGLYLDYCAMAQRTGARFRKSPQQFSSALAVLLGMETMLCSRPWRTVKVGDGEERRRVHCYKLPPLDDCRLAFERCGRGVIEWPSSIGDGES